MQRPKLQASVCYVSAPVDRTPYVVPTTTCVLPQYVSLFDYMLFLFNCDYGTPGAPHNYWTAQCETCMHAEVHCCWMGD